MCCFLPISLSHIYFPSSEFQFSLLIAGAPIFWVSNNWENCAVWPLQKPETWTKFIFTASLENIPWSTFRKMLTERNLLGFYYNISPSVGSQKYLWLFVFLLKASLNIFPIQFCKSAIIYFTKLAFTSNLGYDLLLIAIIDFYGNRIPASFRPDDQLSLVTEWPALQTSHNNFHYTDHCTLCGQSVRRLSSRDQLCPITALQTDC